MGGGALGPMKDGCPSEGEYQGSRCRWESTLLEAEEGRWDRGFAEGKPER